MKKNHGSNDYDEYKKQKRDEEASIKKQKRDEDALAEKKKRNEALKNRGEDIENTADADADANSDVK